jgi:hypothetical protein
MQFVDGIADYFHSTNFHSTGAEPIFARSASGETNSRFTFWKLGSIERPFVHNAKPVLSVRMTDDTHQGHTRR